MLKTILNSFGFLNTEKNKSVEIKQVFPQQLYNHNGSVLTWHTGGVIGASGFMPGYSSRELDTTPDEYYEVGELD